MISKNLKLIVLAIAAVFAFTLTSCSEDIFSSNEDSQNFTQGDNDHFDRRGPRFGDCFEFVFPISIQFADDSVAEISDREDFKVTVEEWFDASGAEKTKENRPEIIFPVNIVINDEEVTVNSKEELHELTKDCRRKGRKKGKGHRRGHGPKLCVDLIFPVSMNVGGEEIVISSEEALKTTLKEYRKSSGRGAERPEFVWPIQVQTEDSTVVEVTSQEQFHELNKACIGDRRDHRKPCFDFQYPVSVDFAGEVQEFSDKETLKDAMRSYRKNNGRDADRPEFIFPVTVVYEDGSTAIANDKSELRALHRSCN